MKSGRGERADSSQVSFSARSLWILSVRQIQKVQSWSEAIIETFKVNLLFKHESQNLPTGQLFSEAFSEDILK